MAGNGYLDKSPDSKPMQFLPVHKNRDVARHLRDCFQLTRFESIVTRNVPAEWLEMITWMKARFIN